MLLVFLDRSNAPGISRPISELLRNTYHELYHAIQQKELESVNTDVSYDLFATQ